MVDIIGEGAQDPQAQIHIDPMGLNDVVCECGNYTFVPVLLFKIVPSIVSPNGKEGHYPLQIFACNSCGVIPPRFLKVGWFKDSGDESNTSQPATPIIESS